VSDVVGFDAAGLIVPPADAFEMIAPFEGDDFGVGSEDNGWILFDATNQESGKVAGIQYSRGERRINLLGTGCIGALGTG